MRFTETGASEFLRIFEENQLAIRHFPGCHHLELLRDINTPHSFSTLSHWMLADDLERYRESPLFKQVWRQVKPLFAERPQAFSFQKLATIDSDRP